MATPDASIATSTGDLLAAKALSGGRKAEVGVIADASSNILFGADLPGYVQGEVAQDSTQHTAVLGALAGIGTSLDTLAGDLAGAGADNITIDTGGLTAISDYATALTIDVPTTVQEFVNYFDLVLADIVSRLVALEP